MAMRSAYRGCVGPLAEREEGLDRKGRLPARSDGARCRDGGLGARVITDGCATANPGGPGGLALRRGAAGAEPPDNW